MTLGLLGVGAYIAYRFLTGDIAKQTIKPTVKYLIETNKEITADIVARREDFGIPGSINPPGFVGGTPLTPGWLGLPPSGSAGMMVYSKKFAEWWK